MSINLDLAMCAVDKHVDAQTIAALFCRRRAHNIRTACGLSDSTQPARSQLNLSGISQIRAALFRRRRAKASKLPQANIIPGSPAPTTGTGTGATSPEDIVAVAVAPR